MHANSVSQAAIGTAKANCLSSTSRKTLRAAPLQDLGLQRHPFCRVRRSSRSVIQPFRFSSYKVEIQHAGGTTTLEVEEGDTILETALEAGLELSHDCKMGVSLPFAEVCLIQLTALSNLLQTQSML